MTPATEGEVLCLVDNTLERKGRMRKAEKGGEKKGRMEKVYKVLTKGSFFSSTWTSDVSLTTGVQREK